VQKRKPLATGLALLFFALFLVSLAFRFWSNDRAWQETGPTHIAADSGQVYLFAAGELYHLSFEGDLLGQYAGEITGLNDDPIDIRLHGKQLLIAEQQPARIRLCHTDNWICRDLAPGLVDKLERQFKVLLSGQQHNMLVTDARGDTLWGVTEPASEVRQIVPERLLAGPNDLALDDNGHLWVADTDHRRIIELIPNADGVMEPGREHSAKNKLTVGERFYPAMLALAENGKWWVTQASEFLDGFADLVVYDPDEGAISRIDLPGSIFAADIAAAGSHMLVTDFEQFAVYRVNTGTHQVSVFGDAQFVARMSMLKAQKEQYTRISSLAMAGLLVFGLLMIVAAILATPRNKRWTRQSELINPDTAAETVPRVSGTYWLQRNPALDRSLKWLEILSFAIVVVMIAGGLVLYAWMKMQAGAEPGADLQTKLDELGFFLLAGGLIMVSVVPLVRYGTQSMKRRLGTDGRQLYIQLNDGRELVVPPTELAYTSRAILYRQYSMPLQTSKRQNIYQDGEVETWLLPLLRQARRLSPIEGLRHQWKHRDALLMWSLAGGAVIGLLLILMSVSGK